MNGYFFAMFIASIYLKFSKDVLKAIIFNTNTVNRLNFYKIKLYFDESSNVLEYPMNTLVPFTDVQTFICGNNKSSTFNFGSDYLKLIWILGLLIFFCIIL